MWRLLLQIMIYSLPAIKHPYFEVIVPNWSLLFFAFECMDEPEFMNKNIDDNSYTGLFLQDRYFTIWNTVSKLLPQ